ncbi:MAG: FG-GAP-like repeat-containing protein, partial [Terriglobales bacterium]
MAMFKFASKFKIFAIALVSTLLFVLLIAILAASGSAPNPIEAARLNNIGVAYMNQQLFEKALKSFEAAAVNDPALEVVTVNRGVALLNLQRGEEAKALLEIASKTNPKDAHAWYNLGLYYKNSSEAGSAADAFRRVTEIDANDADAWYFLGSTYSQLKQFPEAVSAFEQALKLDPHHASAQFGLARAYQQSGQADPAHEAMKKFQYITQNKLGAPISLSYGEQGKYSRAEDSPMVVEKVGAAIPVRFVDVTEEAGIISKPRSEIFQNNEVASLFGPGACFLDYDGDGRIDLLVTDNGPQRGLALYHNLGGKFEDVTVSAGLNVSLRAVACTAGDYDNDGFEDLALSLYQHGVALLHNEKNGTFKDVTEAAGINQSAVVKIDGENAGLAFIDYDHDGDLDLYVSRYYSDVRRFGGLPGANLMLRNNGNGTFTNVTEIVGLTSPESSLGAIGTDFNND